MLVSLIACVRTPTPSESPSVPLRYQLQLDAAFSSELGEEALHFVSELTMTRARLYRDGSVGWVVTFEQATSGGGRHDLSGRAFELRRFPDGELLSVDQLDHAMGPGRSIEAFDVLFFALVPNPPDQPLPRRVSWPTQDEQGNGFWNQAMLQWSPKGAYEGTWWGEGSDSWDGRDVGLEHRGSAKGVVDLDQGVLQHHTFEWERTITLTGEAGAVSQDQRFVGVLEAL